MQISETLAADLGNGPETTRNSTRGETGSMPPSCQGRAGTPPRQRAPSQQGLLKLTLPEIDMEAHGPFYMHVPLFSSVLIGEV